jgi:hypothetical protein
MTEHLLNQGRNKNKLVVINQLQAEVNLVLFVMGNETST